VASSRLGDVQQVAHLHRRRLGCELAQLGVGDAVQWRLGVYRPAQPFQPLHPKPDRLGRRGPRHLLEAIEWGGRTVGRPGQQRVQRCRILAGEAFGHPVEHASMNLRPQFAGEPVQRAERRQVDGRGLQRFNCPVDEVGRVAHRFGGSEDGLRQQPFDGFAIRRDMQMRPNRGVVAIERARVAQFVSRRWRGRQFELRADMRHDAGVDVAGRRKAPEIPPRLERQRQQQAAGVAARVPMDERDVRFGQVVADPQLLAGQLRTRTRIGGAVDGCHRLSGKGYATWVVRSVWFEGLGR
jgi:hypothetical protein